MTARTGTALAKDLASALFSLGMPTICSGLISTLAISPARSFSLKLL
jgi:hypothetical protein